MLFTSPMFVFLFLPASALGFLAFGKHHKRIFLFAVCVCFHLLLNLHHPWLLAIPLFMILYTWFGGKAVMRYRKSLFIFAVCVVPYLGLVLMRNVAHIEGSGFLYPVGMTIWAMSSTSYLLEAVRGNIKKRNRFFDLCFYMLFFPILLAGPFVKYPEFLRLTEEDRIDPCPKNLSEGVILFASGFVKRIAVGAVLVDAYGYVMERFRGNPDPVMGVFLLILIYFGVYFTVTGYADMGGGIARMFGIRLRIMPTNPFRASLPDEYSKNLFPTLPMWLDDYVVSPLMRMSRGRFAHLIHALAYGGCLLLIVRPSLFILLLAAPSVGIEYICSRFRLQERLEHRSGLKVLMTLLTMTVISIGWVFITMGDVGSVLEYFTRLTNEHSEYYTDLVLVALSGTKYLLVLFVAAILLLPSFGRGRLLRGRTAEDYTVREVLYMLAILLLFLFALLFFLPQYGEYNTVVFRYIYI